MPPASRGLLAVSPRYADFPCPTTHDGSNVLAWRMEIDERVADREGKKKRSRNRLRVEISAIVPPPGGGLVLRAPWYCCGQASE